MNMKNKITALTLSLVTSGVFAQDTLRTNGFDVIKDFKPTLSEIIKIASNPNPEVPEVTAPKLQYTLPETRYQADATVYTIKPLSMGTALLPKLKSNYFKVGYGNYNSPILEAYVNTMRNKTSQAGVYVKHFSANPSDSKQAYSDNQVNMWGKRFFSKGMLSSNVTYNRNVIHYYGYQPANIDIAKNDLRRQYAALDLYAGYSNIIKDTSKVKFNVDVNFYNFIDNNNIKENDFKINGLIEKRISGNPLKVALGVNTNNTSFNGTDYNRVFVDINPEYTLVFNNKAFIKLGFNSTIYNDSNGGDFFFYPKAEASYQITPKTITAYAGITGKLNRNTYRSIASENPFISNFALMNTENKFEFYAGFKGEISAQTSFVLQYSHATMKNMLFYGFDSLGRGQVVIYDTVNSGLNNVKAELNHEFGERFHFNFVMNYYGYNLGIKTPYSRPTFTTRTALFYNMSDKFIIRADIYTMNKRQSIEYPSKNSVSLKGITDLNFGIDYRYNKNIGLFLNFNNITNNKYQRWMNYQAFGFNLLGGLTVTF